MADAGDDELTVVFIDNFDSFTYNLVEYVSEHASCQVYTNTTDLETVKATDPDAIIISPGPGHPARKRDVGITTAVLQEVSPSVPTLGVCLGLEAAAYVFGGTVDRAPEPVHGKADPVAHDERGLFQELPQGFQGGRYHSLIATEIPDCFEITARTDHGAESLVMGLRHERYPLSCVQFHPESVLTAVGHDLIENFLAEATAWASGGSVWRER